MRFTPVHRERLEAIAARKTPRYGSGMVRNGDVNDAKAAEAALDYIRTLEMAIRLAEFSAYPAHGSGFIVQATGIDVLMAIKEDLK